MSQAARKLPQMSRCRLPYELQLLVLEEVMASHEYTPEMLWGGTVQSCVLVCSEYEQSVASVCIRPAQRQVTSLQTLQQL